MQQMNGSDPEVAFEDWTQRVSMKTLKCRVQGHRFADWDDRRRAQASASHGVVSIEVPCLRNCGTTATTYIDDDGFIARARKVLHYEPDAYLMPKEARGPGLTGVRRAKLRREFITRLGDWITSE